MQSLIRAAGLVFLAAGFAAAQPAKIDFRTQIMPIFQDNCISCHGPSQQLNGLRLDRRRDAMRGGTVAVIGPTNGSASRLYLRVAGNQFGLRMPPTGPLPQEQIDLIKNWIDQGAEWPDDLAGETAAPPPDPVASQMMQALRNGEKQNLAKMLREHPESANRYGPAGNTPLMYAALYGDLAQTKALLDAGADPNHGNDSGATALIWAIESPEKTRLLTEHKADPNARSLNGRTALLIAASRPGGIDTVKALLDAGANANFQGIGNRTALGESATFGDEPTFRLLLARGADPKTAGPAALWYSARAKCTFCFDTLMKAAPPNVRTVAAFLSAPPRDDARFTKIFLDHGVSAAATEGNGRSLLMAAASSDEMPIDTISALVSQGADLNVTGPKGATALDYALMRGETPVSQLLASAGAKPSEHTAAHNFTPSPAKTPRAAIERILPTIQQADTAFLRKAGCLSCHNNNLSMMSIAAARSTGIAVNREMETQQTKATLKWLDDWRDRVLQGVPIPGDVDTTGYTLLALAAANQTPNESTDALARYLKTHQQLDGSWKLFAYRPPIESSEIEVTAEALRSLQVYAPKTQREEYDQSVRHAAEWLAQAEPRNNEDRAFQLLGLKWAGSKRDALDKIAQSILADQRPDGGWAQLPTLSSDAYATGQALYALRESGMINTNHKAYQRGVEYLRTTQLADGSWHVGTRALPVQPYFESGFPHGVDQFISMAATNWAVLALAPVAK